MTFVRDRRPEGGRTDDARDAVRGKEKESARSASRLVPRSRHVALAAGDKILRTLPGHLEEMMRREDVSALLRLVIR